MQRIRFGLVDGGNGDIDWNACTFSPTEINKRDEIYFALISQAASQK